MIKAIVILLFVCQCRSQQSIHNLFKPISPLPSLKPLSLSVPQPAAIVKEVVEPEAHVVYSQEILPVQNGEPQQIGLQARAGPQVIQLKADDVPIVVHFQTSSAPVQVQQSHLPSQPEEVTITRSEEQPHRVIHEVIRPVIQEVREIIQPYRRVTQEVRPVEEAVHTNVAAGAAPASAVEADPVSSAVSIPNPLQNLQPLAPASVTALTDSYIQQFIEKLRARTQLPVGTADAPAVNIAPVVNQPIVQTLTHKPIQSTLNLNRGAVQFSRKYHK
ncbi:uncharacterized protein LOC128957951 [Oppia nitens]|uniref:uncharacterized protein LOC128957951 n=1 Tax=Oppia nitens TaxID=1686743 RepID=UPI0023DB58D4|nr:uncharacterized protein LOC128957951 [Oppia nitens]